MNPPIDVEQTSWWDLPPPTPRRAREVMFASSDVAVKTRIAGWSRAIPDAIKKFLKPSSSVSTLAVEAARDLARSRPELVAENALLRQQLIVLCRSVDHPKVEDSDRLIMLALARLNSAWSQALHIITPAPGNPAKHPGPRPPRPSQCDWEDRRQTDPRRAPP